MPQKCDYRHLVDFHRLSTACRRLSSSEGAPAGFWEVFCAKSRSRGDVRVKSGEHIFPLEVDAQKV